MHIYLDANSTTQMDERVRSVISDCYAANHANPASQHRPGQLARRDIELFRAEIAGRLGLGQKDRLIFTSGGTESNNLALIGLAGESGNLSENPSEVIISAVEHPSVLGPSEFLQSRGFLVKQIPVDRCGLVQTRTLADMITPRTRLVSLMLANNETGVIQNVMEAAEICREYRIPLHSDVVQAIGKIPVDFQSMGISAMTLTGHKIHGPGGIGGLVISEDVTLHPILFGGVQQLGQRPGTEDVALAGGFAKAIELAVDSLDEHAKKLREHIGLFERSILSELPKTLIHGSDVPRVPHTSNLGFPGYGDYQTVNRQALMMAADIDCVAISTGSACTSGSSEPSHVLTAMGCSAELIESSIRVSISRQTTHDEILEGARRIINAVKRLRQQKSARK